MGRQAVVDASQPRGPLLQARTIGRPRAAHRIGGIACAITRPCGINDGRPALR